MKSHVLAIFMVRGGKVDGLQLSAVITVDKAGLRADSHIATTISTLVTVTQIAKPRFKNSLNTTTILNGNIILLQFMHRFSNRKTRSLLNLGLER